MDIDIVAKEVSITPNTSQKISVSISLDKQDFDSLLDGNLEYILKYLSENHEKEVVEAIEGVLEMYGYELRVTRNLI